MKTSTLTGRWNTMPPENVVPCELCEMPTRMTGTKRCDRCYELESRIQQDPKLARKILDRIAKP